MRSLLIGLVGIDGSGKTTQLRRVRGYLMERGYNVELAPQVTHCRSEAHRVAWMNGHDSAYDIFDVETLAICGALEYLHQLRAMVQESGGDRHCILFDKYVDSFKATAASRGLAQSARVDLVFDQYPRLDLEIFLRVRVDAALTRIRAREGGCYQNETPPQMRKYSDALEAVVSARHDVVDVDGAMDKEAVHQQIASELDRVLRARAALEMA